MADVTLTYKGSDILELSDSGSATLKTGGKYCEGDIAVEYVKPSGGGGVTTKFTGTVNFVDSDVSGEAFNIPLSTTLTGTEKIIYAYRCLKTGQVADGSIVWDDNLTVPFASGNWVPVGDGGNLLGLYYTEAVTGTNGTNYGEKASLANHIHRMTGTSNGAGAGGGRLNIDLENNSVKFGSGGTNYYFCKVGSTVQYEYVIYILTDSGTPVSAFN